MQRVIVKQIFFLLFLAMMLVLIMGIIFYTNVRAQGIALSFDPDWDWDWDWDDDRVGNRTSLDLRYNRVEGLHIGGRVKKEYWRRRHPRSPFLYGFAGYSFKAKDFQYQIGLEKGFFEDYRLAFGGEYHRMIDTPDRWIIPSSENSLAAFLLKEDFHDFYLREGGSGYIIQNFARNSTLSLTYHYDTLDSLSKNTNWSLFGGKKRFRENPNMNIGENRSEIRSVVGRIVFDTRNSVKRTTRGWYVQAEWEHAGNGMGGDFDFDRILVDFRRYQPLGFGEGLDFRCRVGTSHGQLPWHRSYHLGGLGTLRGFPYKFLPNGWDNPGGNRMVLAQLEYRMGSQDLPDELDWGILELFNLILFVDVGWVENVGVEQQFYEGFEDLTWSGLKSDVGLALANRSGNMRIQIARRTDTGEKPFTFTFRINRPF